MKAAFSVLARLVNNHAELHRHIRFGFWELWVIRRLVEPFERMAQQRLGLQSAHRMLLEESVRSKQDNLDGYAFNGEVHSIGVVDVPRHPGLHALLDAEPAAAQRCSTWSFFTTRPPIASA